MAFKVFGSMQFMNSSLDIFVKNLPDNDFKYLSQGFRGDLLKLIKQKGMYPYEYMDNLKKILKINYRIDLSVIVL